MTLLLVLWFCCILFTNQEICNSPGDLPAPQIFLHKTSSEEGDAVVLKCKVPSLSPFTRVIFCKDGKELAIQPMRESKFAYNHKVKANSTGRFTCLYQHKDNQNQERNSLLSATQNLSVTGANTRSSSTEKAPQQEMEKKTILAIIVPVLMGLILAFVLPLVYYLKKKKVVTKRRRERLQSLRERNKATEDQYSDKNLNGYCCGMSKEVPQPIYQNFDPEDVLCSTLHYQQELDSVFPLYVNDPRRP